MREGAQRVLSKILTCHHFTKTRTKVVIRGHSSVFEDNVVTEPNNIQLSRVRALF